MTKYSVFISFKNTFDGKPTVDADIAKKLYDTLTKKGVATFYSNDTIKNLGASEYKQVINDALDSSAVLILIGSRLEHIKKDTAQWVHYEWGNFHSECMYSNGSKILVPYLSDTIARKDKPFELREIQTFTLEKDSVDDVVEFVLNFLKAQRGEQQATPVENVTYIPKTSTNKTAKFLKRAKVSIWTMLSILLFLIFACAMTILIGSTLPDAFLAESWLSILILWIVDSYPFACVLIHYARKLKVLPKVALGIFIALMCLPLVGAIALIASAGAEWGFFVGLVGLLIAPTVGISLSIAYSIVSLKSITRRTTANQ